jgi:hypothetical protein
MARAVSTVLDVSVCLLLVGAAVTTVVVSVPDTAAKSRVDADTTANSLGTVTASVPVTDDRRAHDTLAGHLTTATVSSGSLDGDPLVHSSYPTAVRRVVREHVDERTRITVRWRPYPDAPLEGRMNVGPEPPSTADVSTTRWTIDSGMALPESADSFEALAGALSTAYIDYSFPPERTRISLLDPRTAEQTAARYRAVAETLDVDIDEELADASTYRANERLADVLADRLEADLRTAYESPQAAANEETLNEVELVVGRWTT